MENIRFLTEEEMLLVAGAGFEDDDDEVEEIIVTAKPFSTPTSNNVITCYPSGSADFPYTCQSYNPGGGASSQSSTYSTFPQTVDISTPDRWGRSPANNYT
jgi:hypothetical protein